jgi:hypothetical protein
MEVGSCWSVPAFISDRDANSVTQGWIIMEVGSCWSVPAFISDRDANSVTQGWIIMEVGSCWSVPAFISNRDANSVTQGWNLFVLQVQFIEIKFTKKLSRYNQVVRPGAENKMGKKKKIFFPKSKAPPPPTDPNPPRATISQVS